MRRGSLIAYRLSLGAFVGGNRRVMRDPVLCNRRAITQPDGVVSPNVVECACQGSDASRAPDDPAMQTDRHHARLTFRTLAIQRVECISAIDEEILTDAEVTAALQAAVIGVEAVGNHEMRTARDLRPIDRGREPKDSSKCCSMSFALIAAPINGLSAGHCEAFPET
jgi:hypothetical protein